MTRLVFARAAAVGSLALLVPACAHDIDSPTPALSAVAPDLVCNGASVSSPGGATSVALTGSGFTPMPSKTLKDQRQLILPKVTLAPVAAVPGGTLASAAVTLADDPASPASSRVHWASETQMSFDVAPADQIPSGVFDVDVTNPDGTSAASLAQVLAVLPPPIVGSVAPAAICDAEGDQALVVTGANFLVYDGHTPTVQLGADTAAKTYTSTFSPGDCMAVPGHFTEANVMLCTAITISVKQGDFDVTAKTKVPLVVTNPPPADCASSSTPIDVTIEPPPRVDSVKPASICEGGATITVTGANFLPGAQVSLDCAGAVVTATTVTVVPDGTSLDATFGAGAVPNAACDVIVKNPDGCTDLPLPHKTIKVVAGPVLFFADPEVVFNGINTRVTLYATTMSQPAGSNSVDIVPTGQSQPVTHVTINSVAGHPNRVQATIAKDQAPGVYDVILHDKAGCDATLPAAITVTATTTVSLAEVKPSFGVTGKDTAIEIFRDPTAAAPKDHAFVETPRVFLNPTNPSPTDVAVPIESVTFLDGDRVTGVVPSTTPAHAYDVVLVNPDGTVGVLANGYTETSDAPPEITSATPASIVAATGQSVTLSGTGFASGDVVALTCADSAGNVVTAPTVVAAAPACNASGCTQGLTINASTLAAGDVCTVRVTNPDGTYGEFSAIGVTNSSLNLNAPVLGPDLTVGRRALAAAAGKATATNRFVYAIGGDDGSAAGALDSVEVASVDPLGTMDTFIKLPVALRAKRTLAGAVTIGRYIYLVGGNDGTGPVATAERALILSPRETPVIDDLDVTLGVAGLDAGTYRYRVSAVFADNDTDNPGGESLASDEFTVKLPSVPSKKIALEVFWKAPVDALGNAISGVVGYRVYRTKVDGGTGTEVLLGTQAITTAALSFKDDGTQAPATDTPLPLGSTGRWAALPALGSKREGVAVTWAKDPVTAGTFYVYALLGRSAAATANTSYEYLTVTAAANGRQTAAASWTAGTLASAQGRWQAGAWTVDGSVSSKYGPATTYVFVGGGITATGSMATKVEAGLVAAGGQLATTAVGDPTHLDDTPKDFSVSQAGYGVCAANEQLFSFGGVSAMPQPKAKSASLVTPIPTLSVQSWNDEGLSMKHGRYLLGSAVESSFIFLLGGQTDEPSAASKSTERVIW